MNTIGELVQETIDFSGRNLPARAFIPACLAYNETAKKVFDRERLTEHDHKKFIKENWWLLNLMGMKHPLKLPQNVVREAVDIIPGFNRAQNMDDIILFVVRQNIVAGSIPPGFNFNTTNKLDAEDGEILLPPSLAYALLGIAIFHPVNKNEAIAENYWINFGSFRTFVSELWGRIDLAERATKLS